MRDEDALPTPEPGRYLKRGPFRSVVLEAGPGAGSPVVVKRFHHPRPLARLRDRLRARREHRILQHLFRAGVAVPRPLALREGPEGWEVRMEAVPGAIPLDRLLDAGERPPGGWERLLARLGRALAGLHAAGVEHADLSPKNVLVDAGGACWLIDFHAARLRRGPVREGRRLADVVGAAAAARERLPARLRLRFLAAWRRALCDAEPVDLGALERHARLTRRALVARGAGRWLRESSRVCVTVEAERRRIVRRERSGESPALVLERIPASEARARWISAARLDEHGIPALRPGELTLEGRRATVSFDRPRWPAIEDGAGATGTLRAILADRGLDVAGLSRADLVHAGAGGLALRPPRRLLRVDLP